MIIKRKYAQALSVSKPKLPEEPTVCLEEQDFAPYTQELTPEDFELGRLPDRRSTDRRQGFRRTEDHELISRAHEEANAIREQAAQAGFEEGLSQAQMVVDEMGNAIQSFLDAKEQAILSAADDIAAISIEIAERILKTEVSCDEALVMAIVRDTVAKVGREQKSLTIRVHPIDAKLVKEVMHQNSGLSESVEVLVAEDSSVDQGSCMVETQAGLIDARFSTQLALLKQLLLKGGTF